MKNVLQVETDTFDEVNKVINNIIDNLNLVEIKVLSLDETKVDKKKSKKKGDTE